MYRGPSNTEAALLARNALRSEHDPEHDPEHGPPLADSIAMHPVTGAFTDPAHESAFAAQLFRMAFPAHGLLMALSLAASTWLALTTPPELRVSLGMFVLFMTVMMVGRILLHRMCDFYAVSGSAHGSGQFRSVGWACGSQLAGK